MSKHIQSFIIQYVVSYFSCYFSNPKANPSNTPASSHIVHQKTHPPVTLQNNPGSRPSSVDVHDGRRKHGAPRELKPTASSPLEIHLFFKCNPWNGKRESANISWDLRALTESILVVLLLSLRIQWFFEHQQSKTKKGRVSVNFP